MKIRILSVGKLKESYLKAAIAEYAKRLGAYTKLEIIEVADEKIPERASEAQCRQLREREGEQLLARIPESSLTVALAIDGEALSSEALAGQLQRWMLGGRSDLSFVIGGSIGLSEAVLARADFRLSFSMLTFPHQLMRVILLEQLYRSFKIISGEPYHK